MTKFDESLLEFMKAHECIDCLLDIEGNDKWVEVDFSEDVVTNAKKGALYSEMEYLLS